MLYQQFRTGSPSHQLGTIKKALNFGVLKGIKECSIALKAVDSYLNLEEKTASRMGMILHPLYESLDNRYLRTKDTNAAHDKLMTPHETRPDTIIERSDSFKDNIEKHQTIINIPDAIKLLVIDHTITSNLRWVKEKLDRFYQSKDRFLIIVLWGHKSDSYMRDLNAMLQNAIDRDDGSKYLNNVKILTSEEYKTFLGFDGNFAEEFDRYEDYSYNVFRSLRLYKDMVRQSGDAQTFLSGLNEDEDWINFYLPQN